MTWRQKINEEESEQPIEQEEEKEEKEEKILDEPTELDEISAEKNKIKERLNQLEESEKMKKREIKDIGFNEILDMLEGNANRTIHLISILRRS